MQFQVPQFIEVEDKIFGPFSFKQFVYLAGGAGLAFVLYKLLPTWLAIPLGLPIIGLALALTFYRPNGKPFIDMMQSWFRYIGGNKLYVWKKGARQEGDKKAESVVTKNSVSYVPKLSESKLKDMSWSLDVLDVNKK
jgi:hypothetical protein